MIIETIKLLLAVLSLTAPSVSTIYLNNSSEYSIETVDSTSSVTPYKGAELICENLVKFESYFNETNPDLEPLTATSVENVIPLYIENQCGQTDGVLIDLNDEFGYITIGYDFEIFDIQAKGNQPFYDYSGYEYFFSTTTGYSYYDTNLNDWASVNKDNISEEKDWGSIELNQKTYKGQDGNAKGNGKIKNPDDYVLDKYGSGYSICDSNILDMDIYTQLQLSVYYQNGNKKDNYSSEGNCWIVSAFHVLQYLAKTEYTDMYSNREIVYNAKDREPNIYSKHFDNNDKCKETIIQDNKVVDKWYLSNNKFPELYTEVRELVDSEFKKCDGGTEAQTSYIVKKIAKNYGHKIGFSNYFRWGAYADYVKYKIDKNIPCIWATKGDTYGAHSMAVCGYKYYKKTRKFWIFSYSTYKLFYELRDGHLDVPAYYDISGHIGISCLTFFNLN